MGSSPAAASAERSWTAVVPSRATVGSGALLDNPSPPPRRELGWEIVLTNLAVLDGPEGGLPFGGREKGAWGMVCGLDPIESA